MNGLNAKVRYLPLNVLEKIFVNVSNLIKTFDKEMPPFYGHSSQRGSGDLRILV